MNCLEVGSAALGSPQRPSLLSACLDRGLRDDLHKPGKVRAQRHFVSRHHQRGTIHIIGEIEGRVEMLPLIMDLVSLDPEIAAAPYHHRDHPGRISSARFNRVATNDASLEIRQAHRGAGPPAEGVVLDRDILRPRIPALGVDADRVRSGIAKGVVADRGVTRKRALIEGGDLITELHP